MLKQLQQNSLILKDASSAVFITVTGKRLTSADARRFLREYGVKAGIQNIRVSPHTIRHTFAKHFILNGGDPFTLQNILGHSTMEMTRKYIQLKTSEIQQQHAQFTPVNL